MSSFKEIMMKEMQISSGQMGREYDPNKYKGKFYNINKEIAGV